MPRSLFYYLFAALMGIAFLNPVWGQERLGNTFYFRVGQGVSDFAGDAGAGAAPQDFFDLEKFTESDNFQYALASELGYRVSSELSVGLSYQFGTYYVGGTHSPKFHTVQLLGRYKMGARTWPVAPYLDVGVNASTGLQRLGTGPTVGAGLDIAVNRKISFFFETRFNATFPDHAVDGHERAGMPFDVLSALPGIGAEMSLHSVQSAPTVRRLTGPSNVEVGDEVTFSASINAGDASPPVERRWRFGDGGTGSGLTATHAFRRPGEYTVQFVAENDVGRDRRERSVTVSPAQNAQITEVTAVPNPVEVGKQVRLRAEVNGGQSLAYEWRFGDGDRAFDRSSLSHTYREEGTYTVELLVSSKSGGDSESLTVEVRRAQADSTLGPYTVQLGAFEKRSNAEEKADRVLFDGFPVRVHAVRKAGRRLYRVWAGRFDRKAAAERELREHFKVYAPDAFVRQTVSEETATREPDETRE